MSVGLAGQVFGQALTSIQSSDAVELQELGAALSKISGEECAAVEAADGGHTLDTIRCLPAPLRRLVGQAPEVHGPNCYNLSNVTSGLQPFVRYVSDVESGFYTDPLSGYCTEVKRPPEPGDYVMVIGKAQGLAQPLHSYIHLTDKFAITKNGPETTEPWKIGRVEEIRELYMSPSNFTGTAKEHSIERIYYRCSAKGEAKDPIIRALAKPLHKFGRAMEVPTLSKPITQKMVTEISQSLKELKNSFGARAFAAIKKSSDPYEGMRPLLELYSHIATFKMISVDEPGRFENAATVRAYTRVREEYSSFVKDVIVRTDSIGLVSEELQ